MLAPATDTFGTPLRPPAGRAAAPRFLRSVMPALDLAFGLPDTGDAPDALTALIVRLEAGPLGGQPPSRDERALRPAGRVEAGLARVREHGLG